MIPTILSVLLLVALCIVVARACRYDYDDWPEGTPPETRTEGSGGAWGQPTTEGPEPEPDGPERAA